MLHINSHCIGETTILDVEGRIVPGEPEQAMAGAIAAAIARGCRTLVLNLGRVTTADTSGIRALIDAHLQMRAAHGELKLVGLERRFATMLAVVGLAAFFPVYASEEDALGTRDMAPLGGQSLRGRQIDRRHAFGVIGITDGATPAA
jgi:anti-anti-sigma factor